MISEFNETTHGHGKDNARWVVAKYAPAKYNRDDAAEHKEIKTKRQEQYNRTQVQKNTETQLIREKANINDSKTLNFDYVKRKQYKENARKYYMERLKKKGDMSSMSLTRTDLTPNQRLKIYNRHHNCPHQFKFNKIFRSKDSFIVSCYHEASTKIKELDSKCKNCGNTKVTVFKNQCDCEFELCKRCRTSCFNYTYTNTLGELVPYFQYYDKHSSELQVIIAPLPPRGEIPPKNFDRTPRIEIDYKIEVNKQIQTLRKSKKDRANFFRELRGQQPITYAGFAAPSGCVKPAIQNFIAEEPTIKPTPKIEESQPEISKGILLSDYFKFAQKKKNRRAIIMDSKPESGREKCTLGTPIKLTAVVGREAVRTLNLINSVRQELTRDENLVQKINKRKWLTLGQYRLLAQHIKENTYFTIKGTEGTSLEEIIEYYDPINYCLQENLNKFYGNYIEKMNVEKEPEIVESTPEGGISSKSKENENKKQELPKEKEVKTEANVVQAKSFFGKLIDTFKEYKQKFIAQTIFKHITDSEIYKDFLDFFDTLIYVLKVMRDYINITNIYLLFDVLYTLKEDISYLTTVKFSLKLAHLLSVMVNSERDSLKQFELLYNSAMDQYERDDTNRFAAQILFDRDFGCLTTIIRKDLISSGLVWYCKKLQVHIFVKKCDTCSTHFDDTDLLATYGIFSKIDFVNTGTKGFLTGTISYFEALRKRVYPKKKDADDEDLDEQFKAAIEDYEKHKERDAKPSTSKNVKDSKLTPPTPKVNSKPESGDAFFGFIQKFIDMIPKSFGKGVSMLSQFCKIMLPILAVTKYSKDLITSLKNGVQSFIEWWTGRYTDSRQWLANKLYTPGNPLNDLHVVYMAFRMKLIVPSSTPILIEELRKDYYTKRILAEEYATSQKQYSPIFGQLLKSQDLGMAETGKAEDREFEPVVIAFKGQAGTGKSTAWPIAVARALKLDKEEDPIRAVKETTYTWDPASEYMTGMAGKRVILFDDFAQDKTQNVEALNLVRLVTNAAYAINSANIVGPEVKGMFANPEVIVICTNDSNFGTDQLFSKEAVMRRLDLVVEFKGNLNLKDKTVDNILIDQCERYPDIVGKSATILQVSQIFTVIHHAKRKAFKELKVTTNEVIEGLAEFQKEMKLAKDSPANITKYASKSLAEDLKSYMESIQESGESMREHLYNILKLSCTTGISAASSMFVLVAWAETSYSFFRDCDFTLKYAIKLLKKVFIAAAATAGTCALVYTLSMYFNDKQESGETRTAKAAQRTLTNIVPSTSESGATLYQVLHKATGTIEREDGVRVNGIFIGGHYFLTVNHFYQDYSSDTIIPDNTKLKITKASWNKRTKEFLFSRSSLVPLSGGINIVSGLSIREDIILYKLDNKLFSAEKNITHHFWNAEFSLLGFPVAKLDYISSVFYNTQDDLYQTENGIVHQDKVFTTRKSDTSTYYHLCASASYANRPMSCGSMVINTTTQEHPILGIHIAQAAVGGSLFHFVTRDALQAAMDQFEGNVVDLEQKGVDVSKQDFILPSNSILEYIGDVQCGFQPTKTDLTPSTISGIFGPVNTEPAPLSRNDTRLTQRSDYNHVYNNFDRILFEGYSQNPHFSETELREGAEALKHFNKSIKTNSIVPQKILNLEECINGFPYIPGNTRIELSTSTGYPYTLKNIKRTDLFKLNKKNNKIEPNAFIEEEFNRTIELLRKGIVPFTPYSLTIKDERIKKTKIYDQLKPRLFAVGNIISLLVQRRYFFSHAFAHYHAEETYSSVKMDRLSLDWHTYALYMLEAGREGFDADYKFYDRSIDKIVFYMALEADLDFIKHLIIEDIGLTGYNTLIEWITSPYYVYGPKLYRGIGTMPSGSFLTFTINCDINELLHISAYLNITSEIAPLLSNIPSYRKHNRGKRGGDDTTQTVSPTIKPFFNGITYAEWVNSRGMKCTSSDKKEVTEPTQPFQDLSFLKNTTGTMRGFYVPLTELNSIYEMMNWVRINKYNNNIHKATEDNVNAALRSFYFYGSELYNKVRNTVLQHQPTYNLFTYLENNRIWGKFFYFPGSHSDYATRVDQEQENDLYGLEKYSISSISTSTHNMNIITSQPESGLDKANIDNNAMHPSTDTPETLIASRLSNDIANKSPASIEKSRELQMGTTIQDSEIPITGTMTTAQQTYTSSNHRAELHCNDANWTLERLETKFTEIAKYEWNITQQFGAQLTSLNIPNDILITPAQKTPFDTTAFWRAEKVVMRVIVKGSAFYSGSLVISFNPSLYILDPSEVQVDFDPSTGIQLGGKVLHISDNQPIEFEIPFRHAYGFLEAPFDSLGQFVVNVLNPLRTGADNSNNVSVTVLASIRGSTFKVPEFVPNTYFSHKFSVPESGKTEVSPAGQCSINDDPTKNMVMLCAGKGITAEPKIKQFQDHPVDLIQLHKRFKYAYKTEGVDVLRDSTTYIRLDFKDLLLRAAGNLASIFQLYRGSILIKAIPFLYNNNDSLTPARNANFSFRIYTTMGPGKDMINKEQSWYQGSSSLFHYGEAGEVMVPYMGPLFTSMYNGGTSANDKFLMEIKNIVLAVTNHNKTIDAATSFEILTALADDFSTGVFNGFPKILLSTPESGVLEFIDKAIETTIPIATQIDELCNLLDAHPIVYQPYPIKPKKTGYTISCDNVQYVERLLATNHNGLCLTDKEAYGGKKTETNIYDLMSIKSLIHRLEWNTSDAAGKALITMPVGPENTNTTYKHVPPMDAIAQDFYFWNGSVVYAIDIAATGMHKGALTLSFHPNLSTQPSSLSLATQQYFVTFDLSEGRGTIFVRVPFLQKKPYLPVISKGVGPYSDNKNSYNGVLTLWVQNALRATKTVAPIVDINIYKMAGDDFRLEIYGNDLVQGDPASKLSIYSTTRKISDFVEI